MKKLRNIMFIFLACVTVLVLAIGFLFSYFSSSVGGSKEPIEVIIENGTTNVEIGEILKEKDLIKNTTFFKIYLKLFNVSNLKAGKYELNKEMSLQEIMKITIHLLFILF